MIKNWTPEGLEKELARLNRKICRKQILAAEDDTPFTGAVPCGYLFGIDQSSGDLYYKDNDGNWDAVPSAGGGGGSVDGALNGLYLDGDDVKLGGALIEETQIITGLNNFNIGYGDIYEASGGGACIGITPSTNRAFIGSGGTSAIGAKSVGVSTFGNTKLVIGRAINAALGTAAIGIPGDIILETDESEDTDKLVGMIDSTGQLTKVQLGEGLSFTDGILLASVATPTLDEVTTAGATTANNITIGTLTAANANAFIAPNGPGGAGRLALASPVSDQVVAITNDEVAFLNSNSGNNLTLTHRPLSNTNKTIYLPNISADKTIVTSVNNNTADTAGNVTVPTINATDVQVFATSGSWVKPTGAKTIEVFVVGAGGGGGAGYKGAAAGIRCGGGAGGGGGFSLMSFDVNDITSPVTVTVGTAGTGGVSQTTNTTNGAAGTAGTASTFGVYLKANGGSGGSGGTISNGLGGAGGTGLISNGGAGAAANVTGSTGATAGAINFSPGGGGAGGGITATNVQNIGGSGNTPQTFSNATLSSNSGAIATAGTTGASTAKQIGAGGGGGGASNTTNAGAGGVGGNYGAGGGGGGAATDSVGNSGAGGNGASGVVIVTTYF